MGFCDGSVPLRNIQSSFGEKKRHYKLHFDTSRIRLHSSHIPWGCPPHQKDDYCGPSLRSSQKQVRSEKTNIFVIIKLCNSLKKKTFCFIMHFCGPRYNNSFV